MSQRSVIVADADAAEHEAAMRAAGMHLLERARVDQSSCRYTWSSSPVAADKGPSGEPAHPSPPPHAPAASTPGADKALEALTDDLIAGYQATLSQARGLEVDQRAQVTHVVAESARHAGQRARNYRSEAVADRLDRFHRDLPDLLGKVLGIAGNQARKWMQGQLSSALASGGLGMVALKFYGAVGALVGGALGFLAVWASLGAELFKSGSGIHLVMGALYVFGGYVTNNFYKDLEQARNATQPADALLQSTLNGPERRFFEALQSTPPSRATLRASGVAEAGMLIVGVVIVCAVLGAVVFGGLASTAANSS